MKRPDFSRLPVCSRCEKIGEGSWPPGWVLGNGYWTCPECMHDWLVRSGQIQGEKTASTD